MKRSVPAVALFSCVFTIWGSGSTIAQATSDSNPEPLTIELARSVVEEVAVEVERLRGLEFKQAVPVEVIDDNAAREHVIRRMDRFQAREQLALTERAYALLRLLPPGTDIVDAYLGALREQAGGFYDPESRSFFLLDDMPAQSGSGPVARQR